MWKLLNVWSEAAIKKTLKWRITIFNFIYVNWSQEEVCDNINVW